MLGNTATKSMTAIEMAEVRARSLSVGSRPRGLRCNVEEHYPQMNKKGDRARTEDRWKMPSNLFENIIEDEEEVNRCFRICKKFNLCFMAEEET